MAKKPRAQKPEEEIDQAQAQADDQEKYEAQAPSEEPKPSGKERSAPAWREDHREHRKFAKFKRGRE